MADGTVVQGGKFLFHLEATKGGTPVPMTDAAVALSDATMGTVTVNPDGTGGVFTADPNAGTPEIMTPSAGGVTGTPFTLDITPVPIVVTIVADSGVVIVPGP